LALSTPIIKPVIRTLGALNVDSIPSGQHFEVIDTDGNHKTGITPAVVDQLPAGYAQLLYLRDGLVEHKEAVWIDANGTTSRTWPFSDLSVTKNEVPAVSAAATPPSRPPSAW